MKNLAMKDLVVGACTGYEFKDIEPFVVSLERSGYDGHKVMIIYVGSKALIDELEARGWTVFAHELAEDGGVTYKNAETFNICVDRFYHYWAFLKDVEDLRYIMSFDVKDVIFQKNPSENLDEILTSHGSDNEAPAIAHIVASSEGLLYKDEPWGKNNMTLAFGPQIYENVQEWEILNAGCIAGWGAKVLNLFLHTFLTSRGAPYHVPGGGGPDQAAYNLFVRNTKMLIARDEHAWACQAGTTADPSKMEDFRPKLTYAEPAWDGKHVLNSKGVPFTIVHQYDRVPEWKDVIDKEYRE
jgi:hypothetical protein